MDWYRITVEDRIGFTQANITAGGRATLIESGVAGAQTVTAVTFFINDINSATNGLDLHADRSFALGSATAGLSVTLSFVDTKITKYGESTSPAAIRELEDALPQVRANITLDYSAGPWSGFLRLNRFGEVYEHLFNCEDCAITTPGMSTLNLEVRRQLPDTYAFTFGLRNLLDTYPAKHRFAGVSGFLGADYPLNHPAGFDGGAIYLELSSGI